MEIPSNLNLTIESQTAREIALQHESNQFIFNMAGWGIILTIVILITWGIRTLYKQPVKRNSDDRNL